MRGATGFEVRPATAIRSVDFRYELADDFSAADLTVTVVTDPPGAACSWRLEDATGATVAAAFNSRVTDNVVRLGVNYKLDPNEIWSY